MRALQILSILASLGIPFGAFAQELPAFRPALLGSGPSALINQIDGKLLIEKGQKDAAIMFSAWVSDAGNVVSNATYRGTPGSELLEQEVQRRLANTKFIPAVFNRKKVTVFYYGTVMFSVVKGKPRLRIFSNQETEELKKESDFVGPQPVVGGESKFSGLHYPDIDPEAVPLSGAAELSLTIDAAGNVKNMAVVAEFPPFYRFGETAIADFTGARFIPAFRKGQPVESKVTLPVYYKKDPLQITTEF